MGKFVPKGQSYLVRRLIRTCRISSGVSFFRFQSKMPFLSIFGPKNQNYQFNLKFSTTYNNSNMQNSMLIFTFFVFDHNYTLWVKLVENVKIIFVSRLIATCRISSCVHFFHVWSEMPLRIISLSSHLVTRLIQICRIQ